MSDDDLLTFRDIKWKDEAALFRLRNNPMNLSFFKNTEPVSAEDHARWFASRINEFTKLGIVGDLAGHIIGIVFLVPLDDDSCSISINIDPGFQSQGIGYRLLTSMLSRVETLKISRIEALIHVSNNKSVSLFEKCGFKFEGKVSEYFNCYVRLSKQGTLR